MRYSIHASLLVLVGASASAQTWSQPSPAVVPGGRNSSAAAYDLYRGVTTLFGGYAGTSTPLSDTWDYDGSTWVPRITLVSPAPRWGHGMVFDSKRGCVVLFGGWDGSAMRNDTWEWNGLGWTPRAIANPPTARGYFGMAYDAARGVVVVAGGLASGSIGNGVYRGDTWEYDGTTWSQRFPSYQPIRRCAPAVAWDETRRETLLFGGHDGAQALGDLWAWNGSAWALRSAAGPSARLAAAFAFDGNCGRAVLHGGADATFATNYGDGWAWDGQQWAQLTGPQPSARHGAVMVHDAQRGQVVAWGGLDAAGFRSDTWELGAPCAREMATLASPVLGQTARFRYAYPPGSAAGHVALTLFTPRLAGTIPLSILGLPSIGACRVDLSNVLLQPAALLGPTGHLSTAVAIPANPVFTGIQLDVQTVDVDLATLTLRWAANDEEVTTLATAAGLPVAGFTATPTSGSAPLTVTFGNASSGASSYEWDFGDGTFSTLANPPAKTYVGGSYTVSLAAFGPAGASYVEQQIVATGASAVPVVSFTATPTTGGAPLVVQFTDTSTQAPTAWQWDFDNDGVVDSTLQNPSWTYTSDGLFSVRLVATNFLGQGSLTRSHLVQVGTAVPNPLLDMIAIAPGTFQMGSPSFEQPVHPVTLNAPFWIGKYEVTQAQYQALMGNNPSEFVGPQRPVEFVSWDEARAYCAALTAVEQAAGRVPVGYQYRLPTEAEWEYCCRAGTTTEWNTGSSLTTSQANFGGALATPSFSFGQTAAVGSYPPNAFGLHDMHGNVSEWCLDSFAPYPAGPVTEPFVTGGNQRVIRSGPYSLQYSANSCRSATRFYAGPLAWWNGLGFRVVLGYVIVP